MKNQLDKIIYFVKNTGDRVIVLKEDSEFVVIPLDEYEGLFRHKKELAQMTEEEILSRVNREIALWRESQKTIAEDEEGKDYFAKRQLADKDFYYRNTDDFDADDRWVEPDWQLDDFDDLIEPEDESSIFSGEDQEDFDFSPLSESDHKDEDIEDKKGAEDISLPWKDNFETEKKASEPVPEPPSIPKKKVNNFGYSNPADTRGSLEDKGYEDDYDHITPPPSR